MINISVESLKYAPGEEQETSLEGVLVRAREIAGMGDVNHIVEQLRNEGMLDTCMCEAERLFGKVLEQLSLTPKEWELFTVLWLYDEDTAGHCVLTYRIAEEKVTKELPHGLKLTAFYEIEQVTLDQFYRACLFHDIGKVAIPRILLGNNVSEETCSHRICMKFREIGSQDAYGVAQGIESLPKEIVALMEQFGKSGFLHEESVQSALQKHRPHDLPVSVLYEAPDLVEIEKFVQSHTNLSLTQNSPLSAFIAVHPQMANEILEQYGMSVPAVLAAYHHSGKEETDAGLHLVSGESLKIFRMMSALEDVLKLSDVIQALDAERPYKRSFPLLKSLAILIDEVDGGKIDRNIAYFIVADEFDVRRREIPEPNTRSVDEQRQLNKIQNFITQGEASAKAFLQSERAQEFKLAA